MFISGQICKYCDPSCAECNGLTNQDCTQCLPNTYLNAKSCVSSCPSALYSYNATWTCVTICPIFSSNMTCVSQCLATQALDGINIKILYLIV